MTSDTEARKSVAMTCAPCKPFTPVTKAVSPLRSIGGSEPRQLLAWTHLDQRRENLIKGLRQVESDMADMRPVVKAILGRS